jgi:hypothetical protein
MARRHDPPLGDDVSRAIDTIVRIIGRELDTMEREQILRETAFRHARCPRAACRRTRRCRGTFCGAARS